LKFSKDNRYNGIKKQENAIEVTKMTPQIMELLENAKKEKEVQKPDVTSFDELSEKYGLLSAFGKSLLDIYEEGQ
jgi:hypothetical protein